MPPTLTVKQVLQQAIDHHQAGQLQDAERLYRAILQTQPNHADANHNLGVLAVQVKQPAIGLPHFKAALEASPSQGQYWLSYIDALIQSGKTEAARQVLAQGRQRGLQGEAVEALAGRLEDSTKAAEQSDAEYQHAFRESLPVLSAVAGSKKKTKAKPVKPDKSVSHKERNPSHQERKTLVAMFAGGRYTEAATLAQSMTVRSPLDGFGWKALGAVYQQMGRSTDALVPMQKAAALSPGDAEAHNNLGNILKDMGRLTEAEASYRRALEIKPDYAEAHNNLGATLCELGRLDEAEASYRRALEINPDFAEAHNNLCITLKDMGRLVESEASCRRALEINPVFADAYNNLGIILKDMSRLEDAEVSYRRALEIKPDYPDAHNNLGITLKDMGRLDEAEASFRRALEIEPDYVEAHNNLGNTLQKLGRLDEAEVSLRRVLEIKPELAEAHSNLGNTFQNLGRLAEAEASYRRALEIKPDFAEAHSNLGNTLKDMSRLDEAEASFRRALEIKPDYAEAHSNLLFVLSCISSDTPAYYHTEACQYGRKVGSKVALRYAEWSCVKQPERLRVGFVSGDFRNHPVGYFLEGLLSRLDPTSVELIAYTTDHQADELTARIKPHFAAWKPLFGKSDEASARLIHSDAVHVLVDLSGHTRHNRLPVFAWKPAPVQVSWLGYFATTGVSEIDYLLGDRFVVSTNEDDHFTEEIWQLPECYMCFIEPEVPLEVGPLPALLTGRITFGCFNNLTKMNDGVVALWSRVLRAVPKSCLFLKTKQLGEATVRQNVVNRFVAHGIDAGRLILEGAAPRAELLAAYHRVDIALDPFPYPGGTTSVEGLWMGVPVITKCGDRFLSHVGETIAHNAGLSDWVAVDEDDYVAKAVDHASNLDRLAKLRAGLRQQVLASPLFDAARFARHFEDAMWGMWSRWLEQKNEDNHD